VSERPGLVRLIADNAVQDEPYAAIESAHVGEGGLMGLAVHPRFPDAPYIYAMHTCRGAGGLKNRVIRLRDEGSRGDFDCVILDDIPAGQYHNGGRLAFGPDGMLYVTAGETFQRELAQDLDSLGGKIHRLTPEGDIPDDNPFPGSSIYSYGNRNAQGLAWHPDTGDLFESEHGPSGEAGLQAYDEINVIEAGVDYGWPAVVGAPGKSPYRDPIVAWKDTAVPPCGIAFWYGDLFVATLKSEALIRIVLSQAGSGYEVEGIERWFATGPYSGVFGRIRDVVVGPDDALYFLTSNRDGRGTPHTRDDKIYRIEGRP